MVFGQGNHACPNDSGSNRVHSNIVVGVIESSGFRNSDMAFPMPEPAPVMTAVLSFNRMSVRLPYVLYDFKISRHPGSTRNWAAFVSIFNSYKLDTYIIYLLYILYRPASARCPAIQHLLKFFKPQPITLLPEAAIGLTAAFQPPLCRAC